MNLLTIKLFKNRKLTTFIVMGCLLPLLGCGGPKAPVNAGPAAPPRDLAKEAADALSDASTELAAALENGEIDPQKTESNLQKVLALDPNNLVANYNMAVLNELRGQNAQAIEYYKKAIAADHSYKPAILNLARIYLLDNNLESAVPLYQEIIKTEPRDWQARLALAQMLFRSQRWDEAIDMSRQVLQRKADEIEAFRILAECYYNLDNDALAALIAAKGLKLNEHDARLTFLIGKMELRKGDVPSAVAKFKEAISYDPNWIEAHQERGAISLSFRDFNNAAADFQAVVDADANNIPALLGLGIAYKGLKRFEDAEKYYKKILELKPDLPEVHWNLAILYHRDMSRYADSLTEYRKFKEVAPAKSPKLKDIDKTIQEVEDTIVVMKKMEERMKKMEEMKQQAIAAVPEIESKIQNGDFAGAEAQLKPFMENTPSDMDLAVKLRRLMAKTLIGLDRHQEAYSHVGFILGMVPEDAEAMEMYQVIAAKLGGGQENPEEQAAEEQTQATAEQQPSDMTEEEAALAAESAAERGDEDEEGAEEGTSADSAAATGNN